MHVQRFQTQEPSTNRFAIQRLSQSIFSHKVKQILHCKKKNIDMCVSACIISHYRFLKPTFFHPQFQLPIKLFAIDGKKLNAKKRHLSVKNAYHKTYDIQNCCEKLRNADDVFLTKTHTKKINFEQKFTTSMITCAQFLIF